MGIDVLIVDADLSLTRVMSAALSEEGYTVRVAPSGEEALGLVEEQAPDLVLMELMPTVCAGIDLAERLKSDSCREVPIIAMSEVDPMVDRGRSQACFEGWLPKPFTLATLLHFVGLTGEGYQDRAG
ncbi:MAG TPA: response regulator [Chloroflexota bacterium]|nr:response regulator [Chloroflexota bacterium]